MDGDHRSLPGQAKPRSEAVEERIEMKRRRSAAGVEVVAGLRREDLGQGRQADLHRQRIVVVGAGMGQRARTGRGRACRSMIAPTPPKAPKVMPPPTYLPKVCEVGLDAEPGRCSPLGPKPATSIPRRRSAQCRAGEALPAAASDRNRRASRHAAPCPIAAPPRLLPPSSSAATLVQQRTRCRRRRCTRPGRCRRRVHRRAAVAAGRIAAVIGAVESQDRAARCMG